MTNDHTAMLKRGTRAPILAIKVVVMKIKYLEIRKFDILDDLVTLCRDQNHVISDKSREELLNLRLLERSDTAFIVPDTTRDIILSMTLGRGRAMRFVNPIK